MVSEELDSEIEVFLQGWGSETVEVHAADADDGDDDEDLESPVSDSSDEDVPDLECPSVSTTEDQKERRRFLAGRQRFWAQRALEERVMGSHGALARTEKLERESTW